MSGLQGLQACACGAHELWPGTTLLVAGGVQHAKASCMDINGVPVAPAPAASPTEAEPATPTNRRAGDTALDYLTKMPWERGRIGIDAAADDVRHLIAQRDRLATAVVVLRDRLLATDTVVAAISMDEPEMPRENSIDCLTRNYGIIRVTDSLDPTDRSAADWAETAATRRMALAVPLLIAPGVLPVSAAQASPEEAAECCGSDAPCACDAEPQPAADAEAGSVS